MSRTAEECVAFIEQTNNEVAPLIECAHSFARSLFEPHRYTEYLVLLSKFHRYSYINVLLIQLQFPSASYLAGYITWQQIAVNTYNDPSYRVLLKQHYGKGIKILIPYSIRSYDNKIPRHLINFPVNLFDISQVNNLPCPEEKSPNYDTINKHLMAAIRADAPYRFILSDKTNKILASGFKSYFDKTGRCILVDGSLPERERIAEFIRAWSQKMVDDFVQQKKINERYSGLVGASSDFVIRTALGLNTDKIAFNYISRFASVDETELCSILYCIQSVSHSIIECLLDGVLSQEEIAENDWDSEDTISDYMGDFYDTF